MQFMVLERFKEGDAVPVYRRFRDHGRMAPAGVQYVTSWVSSDLSMCFQVMEAADRAALDEWIARWDDLVDFEIIPVITSSDAVALMSPRL
jgi:hypothetical protein